MYKYIYMMTIVLSIGALLYGSNAMAGDLKRKDYDDKMLHSVRGTRAGDDVLGKYTRLIKQLSLQKGAMEENERQKLLRGYREKLAATRDKYIHDCSNALSIQPGAEVVADDYQGYCSRERACSTVLQTIDCLPSQHPCKSSFMKLREPYHAMKVALHEMIQQMIGLHTGVEYDIWRHIVSFLCGGSMKKVYTPAVRTEKWDSFAAAFCSRTIPITRKEGAIVTAIALSPNGQKAVVGWNDGVIRCYNLMTDSYIAYHQLCDGPIEDVEVTSLSWTEDGVFIGSISDSQGYVFRGTQEGDLQIDGNTAATMRAQEIVAEDMAPTAYGVSKDGKRFFSVDDQGTLYIIDRTIGRAVIEHPGSTIQNMGVSNNGDTYGLVSFKGTKAWFGSLSQSGEMHENLLRIPREDRHSGQCLPIGISVGNEYGALVAHGILWIWDYKLRCSLYSRRPPAGKQFHDVRMQGRCGAMLCRDDGVIVLLDLIKRAYIVQIKPVCMQPYTINEDSIGQYTAEIHNGMQQSGQHLLTYAQQGDGTRLCYYHLALFQSLQRLTPHVIDMCSSILGAKKMMQTLRSANPSRTQRLVCTAYPEQVAYLNPLGENSHQERLMISNFLTHMIDELELKSQCTNKDQSRCGTKRKSMNSSSSSSSSSLNTRF